MSDDVLSTTQKEELRSFPTEPDSEKIQQFLTLYDPKQLAFLLVDLPDFLAWAPNVGTIAKHRDIVHHETLIKLRSQLIGIDAHFTEASAPFMPENGRYWTRTSDFLRVNCMLCLFSANFKAKLLPHVYHCFSFKILYFDLPLESISAKLVPGLKAI